MNILFTPTHQGLGLLTVVSADLEHLLGLSDGKLWSCAPTWKEVSAQPIW